MQREAIAPIGKIGYFPQRSFALFPIRNKNKYNIYNTVAYFQLHLQTIARPRNRQLCKYSEVQFAFSEKVLYNLIYVQHKLIWVFYWQCLAKYFMNCFHFNRQTCKYY